MTSRKNRPDKHGASYPEKPVDLTKFAEEAKRFVNESKLVKQKPQDIKLYGDGLYGFDDKPELLVYWGTLFQKVISQAGTYLCTGKFHDSGCAIYTAEGGCVIKGVGELVLLSQYCRWDYGPKDDRLSDLADLITKVVVEWVPVDPINSMLKSAANRVMCNHNSLKAAIEGGNTAAEAVFGGNPLSSFFDRNPFTRYSENRDYLRFVNIDLLGKDPAQVEQRFADKDLGNQLLDAMIKRVSTYRSAHGGYGPTPMCCSPQRTESGIKFWVNTGYITKIDGWRTQEEIQAFIDSDGKLERDGK